MGKKGKRSKPKSKNLLLEGPHAVLQPLSLLVSELRCKYNCLGSLDQSTGLQLLNNISWTIYERLKELTPPPAPFEKSFQCTTKYRKKYPHSKDFQFILDTLHKLQDEAGVPRTDLSEKALYSESLGLLDNLPSEGMDFAYKTYTKTITKKVLEHIRNLQCDPSPDDSEEIAVKKKVRKAIKDMTIYMPMIIEECLTRQALPRNTGVRISMYGEPFLPNREVIEPLLRKCNVTTANRSQTMFNLIKFDVNPIKLPLVMALDGTMAGGAKLIVRYSNLGSKYMLPNKLKNEIYLLYGNSKIPDQHITDDYQESEEEGMEMEDDGYNMENDDIY